MKFGLKKLETSLCRVVQNLFRYLKPWITSVIDRQTDGQTDRTAVSNGAVYWQSRKMSDASNAQ